MEQVIISVNQKELSDVSKALEETTKTMPAGSVIVRAKITVSASSEQLLALTLSAVEAGASGISKA